MMDTDEIIKKWLPYLSGIIIIGGLLYLIFFYLPFGIEVVQYIDLSDCLLLRLDKFTYFIVFLGICYFFSRITYKSSNSVAIKHVPGTTTDTAISQDPSITASKIIPPIAVNDTSMPSSRPRLINNSNAGLYILLAVMYNMYWLERTSSLMMAWVGTIFGIGLFLFTMLVFRNYFFPSSGDNKKKTGFSDFPVIKLAFLYFAFISFLGFSNAILISSGVSNTTEKFSMKLKSSEVLNNSDSLLLVGKIKNYYFLFNPRVSQKIIVPAGEVLRCDLTSIDIPRQYDSCTCLCLP